MMDDLLKKLFEASTWVLPILIAIPFHEVAHGRVANWLGDPTARLQGRLSLNPIRHVDPFGTIVLPLILFLTAPFVFGWAKPVPVNPRYFKNPRQQMIWVALAGPGINLILAFAGILVLHAVFLLPEGMAAQWAGTTLINFVMINLVLAVFNMLPIPPLDGSRVLVGILPEPLALRVQALDRYGMLLLIGVLFLLPFLGQQLGLNLDLVHWAVGVPVSYLGQWMFTIFGP
jgi:Zn-dependent protease